MKKMTLVLFLLVVACSFLMAEGQKEDDGIVTIGLSMSAHTQFLENVSAAAGRQADRMDDVELIVLNANSDVDKQISDVDTLMVQQVDAIILNPLDKIGLGGIVDEVVKAGIPLVEVNTFTENDSYDVYVGSNEEDAGRIQGEWIFKNVGAEGNVCILYGEMGHSGQIGRFEGLKKELLDKNSGWSILADQTGEWKRDEGLRITEDWLQRFDNIDVIAAQNDEMAMGALQAVQEAGLDIPVVGVDATPDAIESVIKGELSLTVFQDSEGQGSEAVKVAYGLVKGETYEKFEEVPYQEVNQVNAADFKKMLESWK
jgi:ABC-type sugar transport system substrate-binding protein